MTKRPGIFPTFFLSGFECSTFLWKDRKRRDLVEETQHRRHAQEDYGILRELGIAVSREGIPWPLVEKQGTYDFSPIDPMIEAMNRARVLPVWDLCHYGYPDNLDPFSEDFAERFADYCRAAAHYVVPRLQGAHFFTPINEITFFSFCGGEWGWVAPYRNTRQDRFSLRLALCKAAIAGVKAIREVEPGARMVHIDPLVQVVAPRDRPDQVEAAYQETYVDTFLAWDILCGKEHPELGGSPEVLDIVGANNYSFGQMEYREHGPHAALDPGDDRIKPLCDLLRLVWERYHRPMIIGETSGMGHGRAAWLKDVMEESLAAVNAGMDLQGICLFPAVDMPDWHTGKWLHNGICDLVEDGGDLRRVPHAPYVEELRRWQRELNRVTVLDEDPFSDPVELQDVIDAAARLRMMPDRDWS
ncbi:MAG TPA: family 1 glycosylhydrolase [Pyrinomonadaceae bacterium]|nr:family 1 glycosylhydrolase [Pyrinomonadaceae bacterium]